MSDPHFTGTFERNFFVLVEGVIFTDLAKFTEVWKLLQTFSRRPESERGTHIFPASLSIFFFTA